VRVLGGERGTYAGRLLVYEARAARSRVVPVRMRDGCPACAARPKPAAPPPPPPEELPTGAVLLPEGG
jgi:hypothetical protein